MNFIALKGVRKKLIKIIEINLNSVVEKVDQEEHVFKKFHWVRREIMNTYLNINNSADVRDYIENQNNI
jgi:hypothetical protein